jgi:hypothetical protein
MTNDEFNAWYDELKTSVPSLWEWAEALVDTHGTLLRWFTEAFGDLDVDDCREVTRLLVIGDLPKPFGSDIPAFYRKEARRLRFERRQREAPAEPVDHRGVWDIVTKGSMRAAYEKACAIIAEEKAAGKSPDEAVCVMKTKRRQEWIDLL